MKHNRKSGENKEYVVGVEMGLDEILDTSDVMPLLKAMIRTGIKFVAVIEETGRPLWSEGEDISIIDDISSKITQYSKGARYEGHGWWLSPLYYEACLIGYLYASGYDSTYAGANMSTPKEWPKISVDKSLSMIVEIVSITLNILVKNSAKRKITTSLHDTFTYQSYEELAEVNKRLTISEQRYRKLAEDLEQRVEEKTAELKKTTTRLLQQEKMAAIGQLAAGIAHEINNPLGFIYSNLNTFDKYIRSLKEMLQFYRNLLKDTTVEPCQSQIYKSQSISSDAYLQSEELFKRLMIDFIIKDIFDLIQENMNGAKRIKEIVSNLKDFSHIDETSNKMMNINIELDKTINVLANDIKVRSVNIIKEYCPLPDFFGNPGQMCQVFLNILLNAIQSRDSGLIITIKTEQKDDSIIISIADNGKGISDDIQGRIFEPFFTTKDIGAGTGMGLAVAYEVISNHGGGIEVKSRVGEGSEFIITLPLNRNPGIGD